MTSANGCSTPFQPTRFGPTRACIQARILRSQYVKYATPRISGTSTTTIFSTLTMTSCSSGGHCRPKLVELLAAGRSRRPLLAEHGLLQRLGTPDERIDGVDRHLERDAFHRQRPAGRREGTLVETFRPAATRAPSWSSRSSSATTSLGVRYSQFGSSSSLPSTRSTRQPGRASPCRSAAASKLCQRPSALTNVPAVSANVPIGSSTSATSSNSSETNDVKATTAAPRSAGSALAPSARSFVGSMPNRM